MAKASTKNTAPKTKKPPRMAKPKQADDLKRISGVGPKLEGALNEMGIYRFSQIAKWTKAEAEYVDDHLNFKGRVERDDWIGQCNAYAAEAAARTGGASAAKVAASRASTPKVRSKRAAGSKPAESAAPTPAPTPVIRRRRPP